MTKDDIIRYWVSSSDKDLKVMGSLFKNGHYGWSLFLGHLVLEKLLKAIYVKNVDVSTPFTHDLSKLSEKAGLLLTEEQKDLLDEQVVSFIWDLALLNWYRFAGNGYYKTGTDYVGIEPPKSVSNWWDVTT